MTCFDAARARAVNSVRKFGAEEKGSLIIFSLFLLLTMLIVAGLAVDFMRTETLRTRMQSTLDRSVLAAASMNQALNSKEVVVDYFERAGLDQYLDTGGITVVENDFSKTVSASAAASVEPYFLKFLGWTSMPALAAGTAREGFSDLEISLVLDVSNSMNMASSSGATKIEALKDAAQEFVYRVMCNPDTENVFVDACTVDPYTVSMNLIVYNHQVLVGESMLGELNATDEHTDSSCVEFENEDFFETKFDVDNHLQRAAYFDAWSYWIVDDPLWESVEADANGFNNWNCINDSSREIKPLEEDWVTLFNRIEALTAEGNTSIEIGMKYGIAMLDPSFQPVVGGLNNLPTSDPQHVIDEFTDRPKSFSDAGIQKFAVLMTDGVNTSHFIMKPDYLSGPSEFWISNDDTDGDGVADTEIFSVHRSAQSSYRNPLTGDESSSPFGDDPKQIDYEDFWPRYKVDFYYNYSHNPLAHNWLQYPVSPSTPANKNSNLVHVCEAARDQQVQIFTVGFETTPDSTATMKKCASSHAHHFEADGQNIDQVFAAIARSIQKLKLVN